MTSADPAGKPDDVASNSVSGDVAGVVVQAGTVWGDVTVNLAGEDSRLRPAKKVTTFSYGSGRGVLLNHKITSAVSGSGLLATSSTDGQRTLWNGRTGLRLHSVRAYTDPVRRYDLSPGMSIAADGSFFACEGLRRGSVAVHDARSGARIHHLGAIGDPADSGIRRFLHNSPAANDRGSYFGPGGRIAVTVEFGKWRVWRLADGRELWSGGRDPVSGVTISSDDSFLVATGLNYCKDDQGCYEVQVVADIDRPVGSAAIRTFTILRGENESTCRVSFALSGDDSLLAISTTSGVFVHDPLTGALVTVVDSGTHIESTVPPVKFCGDRVLSIEFSWGWQLWDLESGSRIMELRSFSHAFAASADGALVAAYDEQNRDVGLWDTSSGRIVERVPADGVRGLLFCEGGQLLIYGTKNRAEMWQVQGS
ncbi:WD40 repeat domain-containing protein [Amycolatopsis sp. cg9]|uniref:WD40 repeat domain-containing protein n=1 Tax=Amycolatopsis sp. cg9 TaxID=3238801 RepID=UPI003525C5AE